ncbi:MAG: hypothetical protein KatS3mg031_2894 [Chitinophagales bacterium]|nr:MAG: hypothetical protein KatS3mg031_2894 [Chitinophagales bacterium]
MRYKFIIIDSAHGGKEPGHKSPAFMHNGAEHIFYEWEFNADIAFLIYEYLQQYSISLTLFDTRNFTDHLRHSVDFINSVADRYGADNVFFVSIHANSAASQNWSKASGVKTVYTTAKEEANIFQCKISAALMGYGVADRGVEIRHDEYLLNNTECKGVLTFNGYYTNKNEVKLLMDKSVRNEIALAHVEAIKWVTGWH